MRLIMWLFTIAFALAGLSLWVDGGFAGARDVARGLGFLALLSCPFFWARPAGLVPDALAVGGKRRFMLGLALILATPLLLPWQLWL
jgi:drug/metabolite transporter (DMT)-like permease